jgi:hypothetical protein
MKKLQALLLLFPLLALFTTCTKKQQFNNEDGQSAVDVYRFHSEVNMAVLEINKLIADQYMLRGRAASTKTLFCGGYCDTAGVFGGNALIVYTAEDCRNRRRTGNIKISLENYPLSKWKQKGCSLKMEFNNYNVVSGTDGKITLINGVLYLKNESGGSFYDLLYLQQPSVAYRLTGEGINVKYDNQHLAVYGVDKRMTFSVRNNIFICAEESAGNYDGKAADTWGETRNATPFYSHILNAVVWNSDCGSGAPTSGVRSVKLNDREYYLESVYATDGDGNSVESGPGQCVGTWKVQWEYDDDTRKRIYDYSY